MSDSAYEVRVSGAIPEEMLLDLGVVAQGVEGSQTVLYGDVRDESALFGLLARLRGLGLEVVEVRRSPHVTWLHQRDGADQTERADETGQPERDTVGADPEDDAT